MEWGFVDFMLGELGYGDRWRRNVMECISTLIFSVSINGKIEGTIAPTRGLRQGYPLSPYHFRICAEGLSSLIRKVVIGRNLAEFSCNRGPPVSHLFFADDSIFLCRAKLEDVENLKKIVESYARASSQCINFQKSSLTFS